MNVIGLMNMQYAIADDKVYVLEANPRASRTVPLVSKVCNISMARIATEIMMAVNDGKETSVKNLTSKTVPYYGVKEAVFPFNMFTEVDPVLGPEMRSTGEVLGLADSFGLAYYKAQEATKSPLPESGTVLISVNDDDKPAALEIARNFTQIGFKIMATEGTHKFLLENGIEAEKIKKLYEGRPNIVDSITNKEIHLVINSPSGKRSKHEDAYIRKAAIKYKVPYITTMTAAAASAKGIAAYDANGASGITLKSLQEYHAEIKR